MDPAVWGFLGALAGTAVGAVASIGAVAMQQRDASRRERQWAAQEQAERAREFQRETLLALQDALEIAEQRYMGLHTGRTDKVNAGGAWSTHVSGQLFEPLRAAHGRLILLTERTADERVAEAVQRVSRTCSDTIRIPDRAESDELMKDLWLQVILAHQTIGEALRDLHRAVPPGP